MFEVTKERFIKELKRPEITSGYIDFNWFINQDGIAEFFVTTTNSVTYHLTLPADNNIPMDIQIRSANNAVLGIVKTELPRPEQPVNNLDINQIHLNTKKT